MEKQQYAILFDMIANSEDYGLYIFKPITAIKGKYDEENGTFIDEFGTENLLITNCELYCVLNGKAVGFIKTEEELREIYSQEKNIEEILSEYVEKFLQERIEAFYDYESVRIRETPYDDIIINFDKKNADYDAIEYDQEDEELEDDLEVYNQHKKELNNQDYSIFTADELDNFIKSNDINEIKREIMSIKDGKFLYSSVIAHEGFENCYVVLDNEVDLLLQATDLEELHKKIIKISDSKNIDSCDFLEDYKYNFGYFMLCNDMYELKTFIKVRLESCKNILNRINESNNFSTEHKMLMKQFVIEETNMFFSLGTVMDLSLAKEKYRKFYITQLEKINNISSSLKQLTRNKSELRSERQLRYEDFFKEKTLNEILTSINEELDGLNTLVGLENVKKEINSFVQLLKFNKKTKSFLKQVPLNLNMQFTGNAGTGKTTVANIISKLFYKLEYIKSDKVVSCTAADLIAGYVGQTATKTRELIDKYKGGVIFIDEAYVLSSAGQEFGPEAIVEIIKELEQNRTVFIFAGYTKEMESFIDSNSGIKSRIGVNIEFKDYTEEELCQMLVNLFTNAGFVLEEGLQETFIKIFEIAKDAPNFGNGRFVKETVFNSIIKEHARNTENSFDSSTLKTITSKDVPDILFKNNNKIRTIGFCPEVKKNNDIKEKVLKI